MRYNFKYQCISDLRIVDINLVIFLIINTKFFGQIFA
jgi:hypothetical protein